MVQCILVVALASVALVEIQGFKSNPQRVVIKRSSLEMAKNENALSGLAEKMKKSFLPIVLGMPLSYFQLAVSAYFF